jgi:hypothetical protein
MDYIRDVETCGDGMTITFVDGSENKYKYLHYAHVTDKPDFGS